MYPQILILIFLLFAAILTYGWFYWQRAKGRSAGPPADAAEHTGDQD